MKRFKLARMILVIILLAQLAFQLESCQKSVSLPEQISNAEFVTQANSDNTKALPHTKQYPADVATEWFTLLTRVARTKPYGNPQALRIYAYSGVALYESVVPGMPAYQSIYKHLTGNAIEVDNKKDYYWPACANAAIARISSKIMQNYPTPNLASLQALEASLNASFQSQVTPEQLQFSNEFGRYVADIIYDWSKADGTLNSVGTLAVCPAYTPLGGPGNWVPIPPAFLPAVGACQGNLRSFIPNLSNTVMPPSHPAYSTTPSSEFFQAANEVYQTSLQLTADDLKLVEFWRDKAGNYNQASHTVKLTSDIIANADVNLEDASVLFAKQTMAMFDGIVAASKAKFHYSLLRPITYVRNVMGYTNWNSAIPTSQSPSYPGFQGLQASSVVILENFFGNDYAVTDSTQNALYGSWQYASLNNWLQDVAKSSISSGTEFRFAIEGGITQGNVIGQMINALPFKKQ